eukprot:2647027-Pleurochrysis_carterae.AAC.1
MSALVTVLQQETVRAHGGSSALAATSTDARPVSAARATAIASYAPATAVASVATSALVPTAVSAAVASFPTFYATSHGNNCTCWPPEPVYGPPPPLSLTEEIRRVLLAL